MYKKSSPWKEGNLCSKILNNAYNEEISVYVFIDVHMQNMLPQYHSDYDKMHSCS